MEDGVKFIKDAIASRALQKRHLVVKGTYKALPGAAKYSESNSEELLYSWLAIFNDSKKHLCETFIFDKLETILCLKVYLNISVSNARF